ncbi:hypothetical protein [Azonexus sp.]|uniref:hypothetical protein n=1 Tax=Azonexus sp. TaxID=1872668 RepID=UPI0027B9859D|nr:hypothetical protein [Azonexus sp.]
MKVTKISSGSRVCSDFIKKLTKNKCKMAHENSVLMIIVLIFLAKTRHPKR